MSARQTNTGSNGSVGLDHSPAENSAEIATFWQCSREDDPAFAVAPEGEPGHRRTQILVLPFLEWMVPVGPCDTVAVGPTDAASVTLHSTSGEDADT